MTTITSKHVLVSFTREEQDIFIKASKLLRTTLNSIEEEEGATSIDYYLGDEKIDYDILDNMIPILKGLALQFCYNT